MRSKYGLSGSILTSSDFGKWPVKRAFCTSSLIANAEEGVVDGFGGWRSSLGKSHTTIGGSILGNLGLLSDFPRHPVVFVLRNERKVRAIFIVHDYERIIANRNCISQVFEYVNIRVPSFGRLTTVMIPVHFVNTLDKLGSRLHDRFFS